MPPAGVLPTLDRIHSPFYFECRAVINLSHQTQRWDLDARKHRKRLQQLDSFRTDILSDPNIETIAAVAARKKSMDRGDANGADFTERGRALVPPEPNGKSHASSPPLLLDLSPEGQGRAARAVERRRMAATEAMKGAKIALQDLQDWKASVLAERLAVTAFLREVNPAPTVMAGASCNGDDDCDESVGRGEQAAWYDVDVVVGDPSFLSVERGAENHENTGVLIRLPSWAPGGASTATTTATSPDENDNPTITRGNSGSGSGVDNGGARHRALGSVGFLPALGALNACVGALKEAKSAAKSGESRSMALEILREHVKAILIDLMDLETSIPGNNREDEDGGGSGSVKPDVTLTSTDAGALDVKIAGVLGRLAGVGSSKGTDESAGVSASRAPPLASVYRDLVGGAASASESLVDTAETLAAVALRMVFEAAEGPLLSAMDDAYQVRLREARGAFVVCVCIFVLFCLFFPWLVRTRPQRTVFSYKRQFCEIYIFILGEESGIPKILIAIRYVHVW